MNDDLLLVGSIPFDTVAEVFEKFGGKLGTHLVSMPDGEVGLRSHWISRVHYQVLALHPAFEILRRPELENGVERLDPRGPADSWLFKIKDGAAPIKFGDPGWRLGFARDAINSYFVFRTLREQGKLAEHLRFQISMPTVNSVITRRVFTDPDDAEKVKPGFEAALVAELETILSNIPARDLAIQWDCATEMQDAYGAIPGLPLEGAIERNVQHLRRLCPLIPEDVLLGFHLCFGTLGGWPRFEPDDLTGAVKMANAFVEHAGRRVDWVHIPVLDRDDDAFFQPLSNLRSGPARIYLGAIHNMEGYEKRIATARKYLPEFGVGGYCGFGRHSKAELPGVLGDHLHAASQ
jgi:hypothetical protein